MNTNGGPCFTEEQQKAVDERQVAQSKIIKLALSKQMDAEKMEANVKRQIEIDQEKEDAELIKAKYHDDKDMNSLKKIEAAKHFKEIWEA